MNNKQRVRKEPGGGFHLSTEVFHRVGNTGAGSSFLLETSPDGAERYMIDSVSKGKWHYQDCVNSVKTWDYTLASDTLGNSYDDLNIADTPVTGFNDRWVQRYPTSRLIRYSSLYQKVFAKLSLESLPVRKDFEGTFSDRHIPTDIVIDRDPFDTGFSAWYLVADVAQLGGLWKQLFSSIVLKARFRALTDIDPRATAKQLANDHLAISFGLLPTIADMQKFCYLLLKWQDRYSDLDAFLHSTRAWHASPYKLKEEYPEEKYSLFGYSSVDAFAITQLPILEAAVTVRDASFRRTASYSFSAPEFRGWTSRLKQFVDAFGLLDPAALWDIIPFSFVVDWFFGIGNWLHANRPRLFPADVVVQDYCESKRIDLDVNWYAYFVGTLSGVTSTPLIPIDRYLIGTERYTSYVRRKFQPPLPRIPAPRLDGSGITLNRALISASLVTQRIIPR